ncbi:MAG: sugar ABC transporter permease [Anaerolineae bacterium]|nr:sugar ABC transporter permease [Anaerolineae bacterium]
MATATDIKPLAKADGSLTRELREDTLFKRLFLSPTVVILLLLSIFPLLWSLGVSFTNFQRNAAQQAARTAGTLEPSGFLGLGFDLTLENYQRVLTDEHLHTTARNTLIYVFLGVTVQYGVGLGLAALINQDIFGKTFFRIVFILPMMITPVAAGYLGRMMFEKVPPSALSQFLSTIGRAIGNPSLNIPFFTDPGWAPITMVLIDSWQWIPFMFLLLLAGMQAIPDEIYEAARVDGANNWQQFWGITFPILLPISLTAILIRGLELFKLVDIVRVTTGGGPGIATEPLVMYVFRTALDFGNFGYAAAISYILLILVILFSTIFLAISRQIQRAQLGVE